MRRGRGKKPYQAATVPTLEIKMVMLGIGYREQPAWSADMRTELNAF